MLDKYGADALRLYLINSPVVRAEPLRFREEGVFGVVKDVFLPWYNSYSYPGSFPDLYPGSYHDSCSMTCSCPGTAHSDALIVTLVDTFVLTKHHSSPDS